MAPTLLLHALSLAHAEPPRGEVFAGWSGGGDHSYGYATFQPAMLRARDASFTLRGTASQLRYRDTDGVDVSSSGLAVGPAFVWAPGPLSLGFGIGLGTRRITEELEAERSTRLVPDATLSTDLTWRPAPFLELSGVGTFAAADPYVWMRWGGVVPVAGGPGGPARLSLGLEWTHSGTWTDRVSDVGPVAQVAIRPLRAVLAARLSVPVQSLAGPRTEVLPQAGAGLATYWAW
jgi:hypothetical protein